MLRIGLVGAGGFALRHVRALEQLRDRARLLRYARGQPRPFVEAEALGAARCKFDELLAADDIDAVILATPNGIHAGQARRALLAGKHVFCEKPLALSTQDAEAAIAAAATTGRVLMVGHLTRYSPLYLAVAKALGEGNLGPVRALHASRLQTSPFSPWRMTPDMGGGAPFDLLTHDFDLVRWFAGPPSTVAAAGVKAAEGAYAHLSAVLACADGAVATVDGGFLLRAGGFQSHLRILCEKGHIEADTRAAVPVLVYRDGAAPDAVPLPSPDETGTGVAGELSVFFDAIEDGSPLHAQLEDARAVVALAEACVRAADTGETVRLT